MSLNINALNMNTLSTTSTPTMFAIIGTTPNSPLSIPYGAAGTVLTCDGLGGISFVAPTFTGSNIISTATGTLQADVTNFCTFAGSCAATLPTAPTTGSVIKVISTVGSVVITQTGTQTILLGTSATTPGPTGNLTLPSTWQTVQLTQSPTANTLSIDYFMLNAVIN